MKSHTTSRQAQILRYYNIILYNCQYISRIKWRHRTAKAPQEEKLLQAGSIIDYLKQAFCAKRTRSVMARDIHFRVFKY